jgi:hypothetical protein
MHGDLSTPDPYDVWKTRIGFRSKDLFNRHRWTGAAPAALLALFDLLANDRLRFGYRPQEYPIVRALAALALLNLHRRIPRGEFLAAARDHLDWLVGHARPGGHGVGWGLDFDWAVDRDLVYDRSTPLATVTPYVLEAMVAYGRATGSTRFDAEVLRAHDFMLYDLVTLLETGHTLATSYAPRPDRIVINACAYTLFSHALCLDRLEPDARGLARARLEKLYEFVRRQQRDDGSWWYAPDARYPFIDCFHSCLVLENVLKASRRVDLPGAEAVVQRGYAYVVGELLDPETGLFRRFSVSNRPGLVAFDLYDSAEALGLAALLGDREMTGRLPAAIERAFFRGPDIYSRIDRLGFRRSRNTLRWAVMPLLHALSLLDGAPAPCAA